MYNYYFNIQNIYKKQMKTWIKSKDFVLNMMHVSKEYSNLQEQHRILEFREAMTGKGKRDLALYLFSRVNWECSDNSYAL